MCSTFSKKSESHLFSDDDGIGVEASRRSVAGSTSTQHRSTPVGRVFHLSSVIAPYLARNDQRDYLDLNRPIQPGDIQFISECEHITQHWRQMGWLMLSGIDYTMDQIRNDVMKDYLDASNSEKVIHLIEQWQHLRSDEATVGALVDICCHKNVGGVRSVIVKSLKYRSSSGKNHKRICQHFVLVCHPLCR